MSYLRNITNKWWFYLLLFIVPLFVQPYTSKTLAYEQVGELMGIVLRESLIPYALLAPLFHIATLIFVVLLWKFNKKISRYFYAYLAANFIFIAFAQNITITERFGLAIIFNNLLHILIIGFLFVPAIFGNETYFKPVKLKKWRFFALPLAILAFWSPMNQIGQPNFNLMFFLSSSYGLAFCFTAPVIIFILTLFHPNIYKPAYWFLCIIGVYMGILNLVGPIIITGYPIWVSFLHMPLIIISTYGLILEKINH